MKKLKLEILDVPEILQGLDNSNYFGIGSGSGSGSKRGSGSGSGSRAAFLSGSLSSNGQETVTTRFFAPYHASYVRFSCMANVALTPLFVCGTKSLGDWKYGSGGGSQFIVIDVPIDASNYHVTISFQTTDSNGGSCNWQLL